ncbi:hypothetical protein D3C87_1819020 [compost metagenome]
MDFNAVKARRDGVGRRLAKIVDDAGQLVQRQRARRRHRFKAIVHKRLGLGADGGRRHGRGPVLLQVHVRHAAHMPQLQEDLAALGVDGLRHLAPALNLRGRVDPRRVLVALPLPGDLRCLGN